MTTIQVLGTGCPKCQQLAEHSRRAVEELGIECEVVKITDLKEITGFGVLMTPALAIDGQVRSSGKLLSVDEIKRLIEGHGSSG